MTFDLIIKNSTVFDGKKTEGFRADIGIVGKFIKDIGNLKNAKASRTIDATTRYVCPGFIDSQNHADSYLALLDTPLQHSLVSQGITTISVGHCGASLAPCASLDALKAVQKWHNLGGANINWQSFGEYMTVLGKNQLGVNVASFVGHSTLRRGLLGDQIRVANPEEIEIINKLLKQSLAEGAGGLSLGLVYAHEVNSSEQELLAVTRLVAEAGLPLSTHLRSESTNVIDALAEVISLAERTKARLKISHLKIRGERNFPLADELMMRIEQAYQRGLDVFFDVYPYTTSWTVLYTYLPKWAYEGGKNAVLENIKNPQPRKRIIEYMKGSGQILESIFIASSVANQAMVGKSLSQIATNQEVSIEEALLNVLEAGDGRVIVFDHNLSEQNLDIFLRHPLSVIASDGAGYDFQFNENQGLVHPRCFGTFSKFLSMVREKNLMSWGRAINKITGRPAEKMGFKKRGKLLRGYYADVVVFNPEDIGSLATYENPYQVADGIEDVVVNGQVAYSSKDGTVQPHGEIIRF